MMMNLQSPQILLLEIVYIQYRNQEKQNYHDQYSIRYDFYFSPLGGLLFLLITFILFVRWNKSSTQYE